MIRNSLKYPNSSSVFMCSACKRVYSKKEHLQRHERTHTGAKPFQCSICARGFTRRDVLNRHISTHRNEIHVPSTIEDSSIPSYAQDVPPVYDNLMPTHANSRSSEGASVGIPVTSEDSIVPENDSRVELYDASSLLWMDSESMFYNLFPQDCSLPDQHIQPQPLSTVSQNIRHERPDLVSADEFANDDQGSHQAINAANSLINNIVTKVTLSPELANLTPSFLDCCLHMFHCKFMPMFPVVHRASSTLRDWKAPILLNAVALGSLFHGSHEAMVKGQAFWNLAHTAIAMSWPSMLCQKGEHDSCNGIQLVSTAVLGQVYAALSRDKVLRMTSQTFYGMNINWARYCGMYSNLQPIKVPSMNDPRDRKMETWKRWIARENQLRTLLGLFIVGGVVHQFCESSISIWSLINSLPRPCDSVSFAADTPDKWIESMMKKDRIGTLFSDLSNPLFGELDDPKDMERFRLSLFDIKVLIEVIGSVAAELEDTQTLLPASGVVSNGQINRALARIRQHILDSRELTGTERQLCLLRWHAVSMNMVTNSARGARRMCYQNGIVQHIFGGETRKEEDIDPDRWLRGQASRKCLLHAVQIQEIASQMPLGISYDEYLPGALFAAATTYASFALGGKPKVVMPASTDWNTVLFSQPGQESSAIEARLEEKSDTRNTRIFLGSGTSSLKTECETRNLSYELGLIRHLLRGLSLQWGVAQEMEEVVGAWTRRFEENYKNL